MGIINTSTKLSTRLFNAALLIIAKDEEKLRCPVNKVDFNGRWDM